MNIEEIKKFVSKYRLWIIWAAAVLVIAIIIILIINSRRANQPSITALIETPLEGGTAHTVVVNKNIVEESEFPSSLDVYNLVQRNYNTEVDNFLTLLKKSDLKKTSVQSALYTWVQGEDYVEYIPNLQSLSFSFSTPVDTGIDVRVSDNESAKDYLEELFNKLLSRNYSFMNVKLSSSATQMIIEGNRVVNGFPLYLRGSKTYSDTIVLTKDGRVVSGSLLLMEYSQEKKEKIRLVHISNLQSAMSNSQYPKEVFQGFIPGSVEAEEGDGPIEVDGILYGDVTELSAEFPKAISSSAREVKLIYLFSDMSVTQLSPAYRIDSTGFVVFDSKTVEVPIVILANALDPNRVYVDGQE